MLTLKFHNKVTDKWEVIVAERYTVEREFNDSKIVEVFTADSRLNYTIAKDDDSFHVCYVVNNDGNTVDRIHP